jgi:hypothetical protein
MSAIAGKPEKDLNGKWKLVSIETSVPMFDAIVSEKIKENEGKEPVVEFTANGTLKMSGSEKIRYSVVDKKKIKFSTAVSAEKTEDYVADFEIKDKEMKLTLPYEESKRLILSFVSQHEKSDSEKLIAGMITNFVQNNKISLVFVLKQQ